MLSPGKKRPNGGNGGAGGDVYIVADKNIASLNLQTSHFNGGDGKNGGSEICLANNIMLLIPLIMEFMHVMSYD